MGARKDRPNWTDLELALLDRNYATIGPDGCAEILHQHSRKTIVQRAYLRGLRWESPCRKRKPRTEAQLDAANRIKHKPDPVNELLTYWGTVTERGDFAPLLAPTIGVRKAGCKRFAKRMAAAFKAMGKAGWQ